MKTNIKYITAVSLALFVGFTAVGTVTAGEEPIWHNFMNETTLSGTAPSEELLTETARIWMVQVEEIQKSYPQEEADRRGFPVSLAETGPIWQGQCNC